MLAFSEGVPAGPGKQQDSPDLQCNCADLAGLLPAAVNQAAQDLGEGSVLRGQ